MAAVPTAMHILHTNQLQLVSTSQATPRKLAVMAAGTRGTCLSARSQHPHSLRLHSHSRPLYSCLRCCYYLRAFVLVSELTLDSGMHMAPQHATAPPTPIISQSSHLVSYPQSPSSVGSQHKAPPAAQTSYKARPRAQMRPFSSCPIFSQ